MKTLRRAILIELDKAIAETLATERESSESIHAIRRRCKRIRAYLDLVQFVAPKQAGHAIQLVRRAAARLASFRDAQVIAQKFELIASQFANPIDPSNLAAIIEQLRRQAICEGGEVFGLENALHEALELLQKGRALVSRLRRRIRKQEALTAFRHAYRHGRMATHATLASSDPKAFHNLRKATKQHYYQCHYLANGQGNRFTKRIREVLKLTNVLGESQDLEVLTQALSKVRIQCTRKQCSDSAVIDQAIAGCDASMLVLHAQAQQLASQLFFDSPKKFASSLKR